MLNRSVMEFVRRLETDRALRKKLEQIDTANGRPALVEVSRIAAQAGFSFTPVELEACLQQLTSTRELSGAELDEVAAGTAGADDFDGQTQQLSNRLQFLRLLGVQPKP